MFVLRIVPFSQCYGPFLMQTSSDIFYDQWSVSGQRKIFSMFAVKKLCGATKICLSKLWDEHLQNDQFFMTCSFFPVRLAPLDEWESNSNLCYIRLINQELCFTLTIWNHWQNNTVMFFYNIYLWYNTFWNYLDMK